MVKSDAGDSYESEMHEVFGPKVLISIGAQDRRLQERGFEINLVKATKNKPEKFNVRNLPPLLTALKQRLPAWVAMRRDRVREIYNDLLSKQSELQDLSTPRLMDLSFPLLAVAKDASPEIAGELKEYLRDRSFDAQEEATYGPRNRLIEALLDFMGREETRLVLPKELYENQKFRSDFAGGIDTSPESIGTALRKLGLQRRSSHKREYVLNRAELEKLRA
jgi:hypothetical protein